jgi:hypothetical protein
LLQKNRLADQRIALNSQARETTDLAQVRADLDKIMEPLRTLRATWPGFEPERTFASLIRMVAEARMVLYFGG